ncbi:MAG: hypothetical protein ACLS43_08095 [Evtepia gabavorous]
MRGPCVVCDKVLAAALAAGRMGVGEERKCPSALRRLAAVAAGRVR